MTETKDKHEPKNCANCGREFNPNRAYQRFCCHSCSRAAYKQKFEESTIDKIMKQGKCERCGKECGKDKLQKVKLGRTCALCAECAEAVK